MAQSYGYQYGRNGGFVRCEHRSMVSIYGVFHFMQKCDFCKSHIWDIFNVIQCTDCGSILHGSCTLKNMLYHVKDIMKHAGVTHLRDTTFGDAISIFKSGVFSNNKTTKLEERQASEQHTRIKLPMERAAVTRRDDEVHPRSSPHDSNVRTWRNGPASEINYVRKTPCYGRPQMTGHRTYWRPNGYVQERRQNKEWMPHPPTHVFETTSTATPLPSHQHLSPSTDYTDQYLYGPESSAPVNGPSMGYPVHEAPKFVVLERVQVDSTTGDRISTTRVDEMPKEDTILTSELDVPKNKVVEPTENVDTSTKVVDPPIEVNAPTEMVETPIKKSDTMTKEVDTSTTEVNCVTTEVDAPTENINTLTEKVDISTTEVDAPTKKVDAPTKKVDEPSENVDTSTKVVDAPIEVNVPTKKVEVLLKKSESMTKEVNKSTTEVNCLTAEVDAPNKKVDEPNENVDTSTMVVDAPIEINTPIKKADTMTKEVDVQNKNVDVPSGKVNTPNENINALNKKVDTSTSEVNCFTTEVDALTKKVDAPTRKVDEPSENVYTSFKVVDVPIEVNAPTKKENTPTKKFDALTKKVNVLNENVNVPSGKVDAPIKNINAPTKEIDASIQVVSEPNKKADELTKVNTLNTEDNILIAEVSKLNEKVDSPKKDSAPTKKTDGPNKSLNASIKKVDARTKKVDATNKKVNVPTKKLEVPIKNVGTLSKKVDELKKKVDVPSKKVDAPNNKVNEPIKNVNTSNKKLNAPTKEADVRTKKVVATSKNVNAPMVLSNVVTKMKVDQKVKTVIKVANEKVAKITVLPNTKETVCNQTNRRASTSEAESQSDMDSDFEIVRKKKRKEEKSRISIPPSSNSDMGVLTKNVGTLSKKVDELKKKVDAPTKKVDAPNKKVDKPNNKVNEPIQKVNTPNKKLNEPTKKVEAPKKNLNEPTKKVDVRIKKADGTNKKVDVPNNKVIEPIMKVNTSNKKLNAPIKEGDVQTKNVVTTSKNVNAPTVLSNVVTKMKVHQTVKTIPKVANEKVATITVPSINKSKETVCKQINRRKSKLEAESQSVMDGDFKIVQKKMRKEEKSRTCIPPSLNSETGVTRPCAYSDALKSKNIKTSLGPGIINKTKVENLKKAEHQTVFILKTTPEGAAAAKMALGKEIKEKIKTPLFKSCRLLEGGDLEIVPADGPTLTAMRDIMALRKDIVEPKSRWPMIMLYGVDKDLSTEEIARKTANLNKKLGLTEDQGVNYIRPIFRRGPRDRATTIWVCAVNPVIFDKIIYCGHVYIGKSRCKVVEFYDYNQCPKCLKFSHQAEDCYGKVTCAHCGEEGHHRDICMKLQEEPKCSNCKGRHRATFKWCPKRRTGH